MLKSLGITPEEVGFSDLTGENKQVNVTEKKKHRSGKSGESSPNLGK